MRRRSRASSKLANARSRSDLNEYMLAKLNRVVGREVENNLRGH
jgi:hypothetical protein